MVVDYKVYDMYCKQIYMAASDMEDMGGWGSGCIYSSMTII